MDIINSQLAPRMMKDLNFTILPKPGFNHRNKSSNRTPQSKMILKLVSSISRSSLAVQSSNETNDMTWNSIFPTC